MRFNSWSARHQRDQIRKPHISQIVLNQETGASATLLDIEGAGSITPLAKFLKSAERKSCLSRRERLRIIDQALLLLEMNYVHLPLKQAMHAINPIQRLKLLKFRLETKGSELEDGMQFHRRLLEIFSSDRKSVV